MESDRKLDPHKDDLPLRANTSHILVRHYVLDLTVHFDREVIGGMMVLFLEPGVRAGGCEQPNADGTVSSGSQPSPVPPESPVSQSNPREEAPHPDGGVKSDAVEDVPGDNQSADFSLVLDCCDLLVSKVEEVDVSCVAGLRDLLEGPEVDLDGDGLNALLQRLVSLPSACWEQQHSLYLQCSHAPAPLHAQTLTFAMDRWSLQIQKRGIRSPHSFPRILRICYETTPTGGSVRWTKDQDERCCVYTAGSPINNRALFPCQEPPVAMSTWQALVKAPTECVVLLSGENQAKPRLEETGFTQWEYHVTMPMPASTFTLAVGHWQEAKAKSCTESTALCHPVQPGGSEPLSANPSPDSRPGCSGGDAGGSCHKDGASAICSHVDYPCRFVLGPAASQAVLPHRVFAPSCLLQRVEATVLPLLPSCLAAAHAVLGVHPFSRLDVLVVPSGFSSLGMASPHVVFLSQSVLAGDGSLCGARLCHEIGHSWFGLAIGARDWTEEWISEGFATYLEDVFWAKARQLGTDEAEALGQLKALLRWRRLRDELQNSEEELQVLRPNKENTGEVSESGASVVKHALNPEKPFMQVHYLKGYFLLKYLAEEVGEEKFLSFLWLFVKKHHGELVLSQDFLQMFLDTFPALNTGCLTLEAIYSDWLDTPGLPKWLLERSGVWQQTPLVKEVKEEVAKWILCSSCCGKGVKRKRLRPKVNFKELGVEQLVLLLEVLLEKEELSAPSLRLLERTYALQARDAEVKHRWCELVVKHKYKPAYGDVEHFLVHDQAMGVYLFGELMLYEDAHQQAMARRCLARIQDHMDQSARSVVQEMIL